MTHPLARDLDEVLAQTPNLWEPLRGQSMFITDGTGFVGTWLMESLAWTDTRLQLGVRPVLLTRDPENFRLKSPGVANHSSVELLRGDASTFPFPPGHFSYVIHAATEGPRQPSAEFPNSTFDADVRATRRVLEFANARAFRWKSGPATRISAGQASRGW